MEKKEIVDEIMLHAKEEQREVLKEVRKRHASDRLFLKTLRLDAEEAVVTHGGTKRFDKPIIEWMEETFDSHPDCKPQEMGIEAAHQFGDDSEGYYVALAQEVKNRRINRFRKREQRKQESLLPGSPDKTRVSGPARETPAPLQSKHSIDDFRRLLHSYSDLLDFEVRTVLEEVVELLGREGHCTSIVSTFGGQDLEYRDLRNLRDEAVMNILKGVTVFDHTYELASYLTMSIDQEFPSARRTMIPAFLIMAVFADTGKLPSLSEFKTYGHYRKHHAEISGEFLSDKLRLPNPDGFMQVLEGVQKHHDATVNNHQWSQILYVSEGIVRENEVNASGVCQSIPYETWFDLDGFSLNSSKR